MYFVTLTSQKSEKTCVVQALRAGHHESMGMAVESVC